MKRSNGSKMCMAVALCTVAVDVSSNAIDGTDCVTGSAAMPTIGMVDERFQSYNIEMAEVIGGNSKAADWSARSTRA